MSDPDPIAGGSRTTLRSGKLTEQHPVIKEKPYLKKSAQPSTRSKTILWLIGEPASLQFWVDLKDTEGNSLTPYPDMTGRKLPSLMDVMRHMAHPETLCQKYQSMKSLSRHVM